MARRDALNPHSPFDCDEAMRIRRHRSGTASCGDARRTCIGLLRVGEVAWLLWRCWLLKIRVSGNCLGLGIGLNFLGLYN
ncbi:hypothetical protein ERO13_D01G130701v2 [Gossypium hirsutum]|uniref:Uncharacterized protein n=1 Tax=Gossypium darwinii TaxID=34276 RepID=A0A5D2DQX1_GOSDA|nr:hypothetical protein ERO13_D01G130701v2 [Gossypium hirsutum]TYG83436.1 hypothetical protein ES288_D01G168200v1 [Gossypium darwinii]